MDSAKRQRREQVLRYYAREKELEQVENESLRGRPRQQVIIISESARLKDAAINHDVEEISYILEHHSSIIPKEDINVAFLQACINGHEDIARLLLEHGASVDYRDPDNWTPAHFASAHGHSSILYLLFEYGADATLLDVDGHFALDYSENATVRNLIAEEMAQSGVYTEDLPSIRMRQLKAMTAAVRNAILKGKDLTLANKNGVTPLHTAAAYGYHEVVQLLVESGSVPFSILDDSGCTPLYLAMKYKQTQTAKYLLDSGAKMEASSSESRLSLERPTDEQAPLLSNQWKLKRPSVDDAMRERHFLSRYIGLVQDSSTREEGTLLDDPNVPFSEILTGGSDSITRTCIPSTIDNDQQALRENRGNNLENSISERVEEVQVTMLTPLPAIPEMIYDTCPNLATPTKATPPQVVEDMYDVAVVSSKPKTKSIYDDDFTLSGSHGDSGRVTPKNEAYNSEAEKADSLSHTPLTKPLVPNRDQDNTPRPTSPSPYETFVSIHSNNVTTPSPTTPKSAPPIPVQKVKDKKNSEPIISHKQTESKKQRSISVDNSFGVVGLWLQHIHKKTTPVAPLVLPNVKKPVSNNKSPILPPRRMELAQIHPTQTQSPSINNHTPTHSPSDSPVHLSIQPRSRPSSLSPIPLSPNHDSDPPPSYATVLHCPDQFSVPNRVDSPPPPPLPPHPSHWLVRPQVRQRSEPNNIGFRKSQLRKISSGPLIPNDRSIALFSSGSDSALINRTSSDGEVVRKVVKPYTFRTRFQ